MLLKSAVECRAAIKHVVAPGRIPFDRAQVFPRPRRCRGDHEEITKNKNIQSLRSCRVRSARRPKSTLIPSSLRGAFMPPAFFWEGSGNRISDCELYACDVTQ